MVGVFVRLRVRGSEGGEYEVAEAARMTSHKIVGSVEELFRNMPKSLEWQSFRRHDLNLIVDSCMEVQNIP